MSANYDQLTNSNSFVLFKYINSDMYTLQLYIFYYLDIVISTTVIIPSSSNNLDSSVTELLLTVTTSSVNILLPQPSSILTTVLDNTSLTHGLYIGLPLAVLTIILVVVSTVLIIVIIRYRKQSNG